VRVAGSRCWDFGDPCALDLACRVLAAHQVAVLPTDTLYGFSVPGISAAGVRRLMQLKGIPGRRGFVCLVGRVEDVEPYLAPDQDPRGLDFLRRAWPAPLTAVLRVRAPLPWAEPVESRWTAAFRVPAHPRLRALLDRIATPLVSTSVNRSGCEPLRTLEAIGREFGREPDVWMFGDRGLESRRQQPGSTVADFTTWPPRVLRPGAIALEGAADALDAGPTSGSERSSKGS